MFTTFPTGSEFWPRVLLEHINKYSTNFENFKNVLSKFIQGQTVIWTIWFVKFYFVKVRGNSWLHINRKKHSPISWLTNQLLQSCSSARMCSCVPTKLFPNINDWGLKCCEYYVSSRWQISKTWFAVPTCLWEITNNGIHLKVVV